MNNTSTHTSTHTGISVLSLLAITVIEYSLVSTSPKSQTNSAKVSIPTFHWGNYSNQRYPIGRPCQSVINQSVSNLFK